ncbi:MAG: hypothetical protein ACYDBY_08765 [Thermoanaerobaculia bacterium]
MTPRPLLRFAGLALVTLSLSGAAGAAPAQDSCLHDASPTLEEAVGRFLDALAAGDADSLRRLALGREEFRGAIWPWLPSSDPRRNLTADFVWGHYAMRNDVAFHRLLEDHSGIPYRLVAVEPEGTKDYAGFELLVRPSLLVEDPSGKRRRLRLFGSVVKQGDGYKVYGFKTD